MAPGVILLTATTGRKPVAQPPSKRRQHGPLQPLSGVRVQRCRRDQHRRRPQRGLRNDPQPVQTRRIQPGIEPEAAGIDGGKVRVSGQNRVDRVAMAAAVQAARDLGIHVEARAQAVHARLGIRLVEGKACIARLLDIVQRAQA